MTRPFLTACLACAILGVGGCGDLEVVSASYATLDEARKAGAVDQGWMPDGLPQGAHDIREAHDPKTSRRWALFSFPVSQASTLKSLLEDRETSLEGQAVDAPARIEWWPLLLRGRLDADRLRDTGLRLYRSADGKLLFAVNWSQGRAYYWTPPVGGMS